MDDVADNLYNKTALMFFSSSSSIHLFFFSLSFSSALPSYCALFCLKAFLSGLLPELPLRCFQHFLDIPHHSFLLSPFLLLCRIPLVFITQVESIPDKWRAERRRTMLLDIGNQPADPVLDIYSGIRISELCVGAITNKFPIACSLRPRCPKEIRASQTFPHA